MMAVVLAVGGGCSTSDSGETTGDASTDGAPPVSGDAAAGHDSGPAPGDASADATAPADAAPQCAKATDCTSKVCINGTCAPPTCSDGVKNEDETDLDCGGMICPACDTQKDCAVGTDCTSKVCADLGQGAGLQCQAPTCTDMVTNGTETATDCGGSCSPCAVGLACAVRADCTSDVCTNGVCVAAVCNDGVQNGTETDVDCGGASCPSCPDLEMCKVASDCQSGVCTAASGTCAAPTDTDGVQNGTETDVDCGGASAPACAATKKCLTSTDCLSDGCDYTNKCAVARSCTAHYGGDTCGTGGAGGVGDAQWESCCLTAPVTVGGTTTQLEKYKVTAGRMRTFLETIGGNVRGFAQSARAAGQLPALPTDAAHSVLEAAWDAYLPTSMEGNTNAGEISDCTYYDTSGSGCKANTTIPGLYTSAYRHVGGTIFRNNSQSEQGCSVGSPGTHTYWMSDEIQSDYFGDIPFEQDQTVLDTKPLQCVDYLVGQAFCVWDGGRLETQAEWLAAFGSTAQPWGASPAPLAVGSGTYTGCRFPSTSDVILRGANPNGCKAIPTASQSIEYADYMYSYEYPQLGTYDFSVFISAPGRFANRSATGHADVAYDIFEYSSNVKYNASPLSATFGWNYTGSWEVHDLEKTNTTFYTPLIDKYGKAGLRCAH